MNPPLTKEDCHNIISKLHSNSSIKIYDFELKAAPQDQEGFFGDSHILKISYQLEKSMKYHSFFVKIYPTSAHNAQLAANLLAYEKEIFYYDFLVPEFETMGLNINFLPKCYLCKGGKIIIMENLTIRNYSTYFRFTLDQTRNGLKSIAEMHGASILYEQKKTSEEGKEFKLGNEYSQIFEEKFFDIYNKNSFIYSHFEEGYKCIKKLLEYLPQTEPYGEEFLGKLEQINFMEIFREDLGLKKVCSHGDLWRRNVLFQEPTKHCKIIDFQMLRYCDPSFDVLSFIYFNFPLSSLKDHRSDLLKYYYESLASFTEDLAREVLPFAEFMRSVDHFELLALYQATVGHTLDIADNVTDMFFGSRVEYCCQEFEKDESYRKALTDDIFCLINYVLKSNYS